MTMLQYKKWKDRNLSQYIDRLKAVTPPTKDMQRWWEEAQSVVRILTVDSTVHAEALFRRLNAR